MQNLIKTAAAWAVISVAVTSGAAPLTSQVSTRSAAAPVVNVPVAKAVAAAAAVAALKPATPAVIKLANAPAAKPTSVSDKALRAQMKFETARWGGKPVQTLDEQSRILLAQAAAEKVGLQEVGLSFHDVYGVIEAEPPGSRAPAPARTARPTWAWRSSSLARPGAWASPTPAIRCRP
jgi:hypothetical protein